MLKQFGTYSLLAALTLSACGGEDPPGQGAGSDAGAETDPDGGGPGGGRRPDGGAPDPMSEDPEGNEPEPEPEPEPVGAFEEASQTIGSGGGTVEIESHDGESLATLDFATGSFTQDTTVRVASVTAPDTLPAAVREAGAGIRVDLGGQVLAVPATATVRVEYDPNEDTLVALAFTERGAVRPSVDLVLEDGQYFAEFPVAEGGDYLVLTIAAVDGCDGVRTEAVQVSSQDELEALRGVRRIDQSLVIDGSGITSLEPLACLTEVAGWVYIVNTNLESLAGLEALTLIGANHNGYYYGYSYYQRALTIANNPLLASAHVPGLLTVGAPDNRYANYARSGVAIHDNALLADIDLPAVNGIHLTLRNNGLAVESLKTSFPALRSAVSLEIANNSTLQNVAGFSALTSVSEGLSLTSNTSLAHLDGLAALTRVGGRLLVNDNLSLRNLNGLGALAHAGSVQVYDNDQLRDVVLKSLTDAGAGTHTTGSVDVRSNATLRRLEMDALEVVEQSLQIQSNGNAANELKVSFAALVETGTLSVRSNPGLIDFAGFAALEAAAAVVISGNAELESLDGLEALAEVASLEVSRNESLLDLAGLAGLESVAGDLLVDQNASLEDVSFPALTTVSGTNSDIVIRTNPALESVQFDLLRTTPATLQVSANATASGALSVAFPELVAATGNLNVTQNGGPGTTTMSLGFGKLTSTSGNLQITHNAGVADLDGLTNLRSVGGTLSVSNNPALVDIDGLAALTGVSGAVSIASNDRLEDVAGLAKLARVDGALSVSSNASIESIALPALTTVGGGASFDSSPWLAQVEIPVLESISGGLRFRSNGGEAEGFEVVMPRLESVTGELRFQSNPTLDNLLLGLPALSGVGSLYIQSNITLPTCQAQALEAQLEANGAIQGSVYIYGNLADSCS